MTLNEFLEFFDFTYEKYPDGKYGFIDLQGADFGDIESERYDSPEGMIDRLGDSIYITDYIDQILKEDGCKGTTFEEQYKWCVQNNYQYTEITNVIYTFLHPETITEEMEKIMNGNSAELAIESE